MHDVRARVRMYVSVFTLGLKSRSTAAGPFVISKNDAALDSITGETIAR